MTEPDAGRVREMRARAQALAGGVRVEGAGAVVRRVFAVQAQDAAAAELGIRVRGRDITRAAVRAAYEDERSIVRSWFMRGTLHTVPGEDAHWLVGLLGPRTLAGTARRYGQLGLGDELRRRSDDLLRAELAAHGPLTRVELTGRLARLGVPPEGQAPFHLIRHAALGGILCHGPQRGGEATYVLLEDWLARPGGAQPEGEGALAELARRYLAAHGPAGPEDFAVWSGLPVSWARRAWKALAGRGALAEFGTLTVLAGPDPGSGELSAGPDAGGGRSPAGPGAGSGELSAGPGAGSGELSAGPGAGGGQPPTGPDVRLLPAYDNYLLAHRTRELSVPAAHEPDVWPGGGVIRATVLADGLVVGTWTRGPARGGVRVEPFGGTLPEAVARGAEAERRAVAAFLRLAG